MNNASDTSMQKQHEQAKAWMENNGFAVCTRLDTNWTMDRYDFPEFVRAWIRDTWDKISEENGGLYQRPTDAAATDDELARPPLVSRPLTIGGSSIFRDPNYDSEGHPTPLDDADGWQNRIWRPAAVVSQDAVHIDAAEKLVSPLDPKYVNSLAAVSMLGGAKRCPHCKKVVSELSKCTAVGYTGTYHCDISMEKDGKKGIVEEQPTPLHAPSAPPADDDGKSFAKAYQQTGIAGAMDEYNKEALNVMANEGNGRSSEAYVHRPGDR